MKNSFNTTTNNKHSSFIKLNKNGGHYSYEEIIIMNNDIIQNNIKYLDI